MTLTTNLAHNTMVVDVSVATIWTLPESPREIDRPALTHPVEIKSWLDAMTVADRLQLWENDITQTQILYGTLVNIIAQQGEWAQVVVPTQPSLKDKTGYPGWTSKAQLTQSNSAYMQHVNNPSTVEW